VVLAFSLVAGLLALEGLPASASGNNVDLSTSMSADASGDATAGLPWAYTITVANGAAADDSTGYTVSVDVPSGTMAGSMDGACQENSGTIDCTSSGLTAGTSEDFRFQLNIGSDYSDGTNLQATASLTDINGDTDASSSDDSDAVNTTVQAVSDLGITYDASPAGSNAHPWIAGQNVTLTAVVTNHGPSDAPDTNIQIGIPGGTDYVSDDSSCTGTSVVTCLAGSLSPNGVRTVNVTIFVHSDLADGADLNVNHATVQTTGDEGTNLHGDDATIDPVVHRIADLSILKAGPDGSDPAIVAGDPAGYDYTLTVANGGPSDANYFVHDTLPTGLAFQSVGSDPACSAVGQNVTCGDTIVAGGGPTTYTIHVLVAPSVLDQSILDNDASVVMTDGSDDPNLDNNSTATQENGTAHTTITAQADLSLSVDATNGNQIAGDPAGISYTYTVTNGGFSDNVGGFSISDTLPAGFTYVASGSDPRCAASSGQTISCNDTANFPVSEEPRTITVKAKIASSVLAGSFGNLATVISNNTFDPDATYNMASDSVAVINRADLRPTVIASGSPVTAGGANFGATVKVKNFGYSDNHGGYSVNVPLPTDIVYVSGPAACSAVVGGFTCSVTPSSFPNGQEDSYSVTLRARSSAVASPPAYSLTGTVTSLGTIDPTPVNNTSTDTFSVITRADLALTTAAITYPSGQTAAFANTDSTKNFAIYEYDVTNNGPSDAQNVSFSDTLPSGVTFVGACSGGTGCTPSQALPLSIGTLNGNDGSPTHQSTHIRVKVTADATLRGGPLTKTDAAAVSSPTTDPGPSLNNRSENATVWTVPSTPPNLLASPGNTNAFFKWGPPTNFGGVPGGAGSILDFRVRTYLTATGTTPERTLTVAPDNCGTPGNTFYCALVGTTPYGPALTNGTQYFLTVEARNVVGFSDPNTTRPSVTPTIDASAQQINNGSLSQHTGNSTLPSSADKQISFQDFPSNTTGVGTVLETNTGSNLFCAGPCFGQIVQTKLQDPFLPGIYTLTLLYDKTLIGGTGVKYGVYYAPNTTSTSGTLLKTCPANITVNVVPCSIVKLGNKGANPALKLLVYTKDPDPTTGGRTLR